MKSLKTKIITLAFFALANMKRRLDMRANPKAAVVALMILSAVTLTHCGGNSARIVAGLPSGIDLTLAKVVEIRDGAGQVVLTGAFVDGKAPLTSPDPGAKAKGLAELEIKKTGTGLKQEIEATVKDLPASSSFRLMVDGKEVATFMTSANGKRSLKYSRKDGV